MAKAWCLESEPPPSQKVNNFAKGTPNMQILQLFWLFWKCSIMLQHKKCRIIFHGPISFVLSRLKHMLIEHCRYNDAVKVINTYNTYHNKRSTSDGDAPAIDIIQVGHSQFMVPIAPHLPSRNWMWNWRIYDHDVTDQYLTSEKYVSMTWLSLPAIAGQTPG